MQMDVHWEESEEANLSQMCYCTAGLSNHYPAAAQFYANQRPRAITPVLCGRINVSAGAASTQLNMNMPN